ncbi:hypothetical protein G7B40_032750 [Aetokthonos hydrillicola Thurmond2011]|jgi:transcriptional regulator with XRE-family HTH domain/arsenate reductase-like glutaredoxin family protein|uniref:Uncharacterized protein n=1 Tax=Aetokthonos hydrillicola Thurmond2011 TaxID=2712845 RepID=A0AAP5ID62_9CYAN|nr:hypothetical protein [Aetokthonos hydrillicola]MBW4585793.1 hypothetical protein [Aetokthonos hydrillicola CCALA 1050]MDR9899296.1 hypothetical protein [Aetokthonos hydrillicola Thurmond2011]
MSRESSGDQEALREMLHFFLDKMGATQVELSEGMGVSRPVVINFLNKEKEKLPVDREGLINLCEKLYKRKVSKRKSKADKERTTKEIKSNPDELRKLLGQIGADELLESAGFLPERTRIIRVSSERFFQVAQVAALLELLEFEDLLSTTQEFLAIASNKIAIASNKLFQEHSEYHENDSLMYLIENLWKSRLTLGLKLRLEVIDKLRRNWERLKIEGKTNFTRQEAIALFRCITVQAQMPKNLTNFHISVQKLEFQTLSQSIDHDEEYSDVYRKFLQTGYQAECNLNTLAICSTTEPEAQFLNLLKPVIKAAVTCSFSLNGESRQLVEWMYTSNNTMVENAIGACSLHIGLIKEAANITISTKTLDSSIDSLVETSVLLGNQQQYQGIWVDRDSMTTMLQAIVCAAKQWLADKNLSGELNLEIYGSTCRVLSELRKRLTRARIAFQNFQFLDKECQSAEIKTIADTAREELNKIPNQKIYFPYRLNLYRCYFTAKLLELRQSNFQGNLINAQLLIQELVQFLEEDQEVKRELVPIQALIQSEIYLYELSCGHKPELFDSNSRNRWLELEEWNDRIRSAIKPGSCYKDPGLDVYQALSEIYGNAARIDFYLCDDKNTLVTTAEYFIRAAYYASRIGLTQRVSRWLALAGRVWVRLGDSNLSRQAYNLANKLARTDLTAGHSHNFCQAVLSEINLLDGEYLLLINDEPTKALERFLEALKGSLYLGLNRRMCDALFNISRCSNKLGNFSTKEGLSRVFKEEDHLTESNKIKLNPMSNHTSENVLDLLCNLWNREDNPTWFQVRREFSDLAAQTWQRWHSDSCESEAITKHPIADLIESGFWLSQVN